MKRASESESAWRPLSALMVEADSEDRELAADAIKNIADLLKENMIHAYEAEEVLYLLMEKAKHLDASVAEQQQLSMHNKARKQAIRGLTCMVKHDIIFGNMMGALDALNDVLTFFMKCTANDWDVTKKYGLEGIAYMVENKRIPGSRLNDVLDVLINCATTDEPQQIRGWTITAISKVAKFYKIPEGKLAVVAELFIKNAEHPIYQYRSMDGLFALAQKNGLGAYTEPALKIFLAKKAQGESFFSRNDITHERRREIISNMDNGIDVLKRKFAEAMSLPINSEYLGENKKGPAGVNSDEVSLDHNCTTALKEVVAVSSPIINEGWTPLKRTAAAIRPPAYDERWHPLKRTATAIGIQMSIEKATNSIRLQDYKRPGEQWAQLLAMDPSEGGRCL